MGELRIGIETLDSLLKREKICIPPYQRPYSWTDKQLTPLLHDLYNREDSDLMIMGGVILHEDDEFNLNIVDGQQRLVSFSIIAQLLNEESKINLLNHEFSHAMSIDNIQNNARHIKNLIERKGELSLQNIHFITVTTSSLEDAFNFFDSQNTRGKTLENYDILKAHHLRFIKSETLATLCAKDWETIEKDKNLGLGLLLETLLARGRKWTAKDHIAPDIRKEFKSQRKDKKNNASYLLNRYQQGALFTSWKYNPAENSSLEYSFERIDATYKVGGIAVNENIYKFLPFQITQTIEGGELFFWYSQKYHALAKELFSSKNEQTTSDFKELLKRLGWFNYNTGSVYTLDVYKGALLFYLDKFGYTDFDQIASAFFYCIYWLRLKQHTVQYNSVYKYIREEFNPFALIQKASFPEFILDRCSTFLEDKYMNNEFSKGFRKQFFEAVFLNSNLELVKINKLYNSLSKSE